MYELCLGDRKGYAHAHCFGINDREQLLEVADVTTIGK